MFNLNLGFLTGFLRWVAVLLVALFFGTSLAGCSATMKDAGSLEITFGTTFKIGTTTSRTDSESSLNIKSPPLDKVVDALTRPKGDG